MAAPSAAIDIVGSGQRHTSSSPRSQSSNLTTALQQAASNANRIGMDFSDPNGEDSRSAFGKQDSTSFGIDHSVSGARPIAVADRPRKESNAGSFMGAMSFGGLSVGSLIQDEYGDLNLSGSNPTDFLTAL